MKARFLLIIATAVASWHFAFGQQDAEQVSREDVESWKKMIGQEVNAFLGSMIEHQRLVETPPRGINQRGDYTLFWGKIKVDHVYVNSDEREGFKFVNVVWAVPNFDPKTIVSYPVQIPSDAVDGKAMIWCCRHFEHQSDPDIPMMLGHVTVMRPSKLFTTVFEELEREAGK